MGFDINTAILGVAALLFLIALVMLGVWAFKTFIGGDDIGTPRRGQEKRLAVVEMAAVDANRKLLLVRRDDVEHLLIIGGPVDLVVETGIEGRTHLHPAHGDVVIGKPAPRPAPKMG